MSWPNAPLADEYLKRHHQQVLTCHLLRLDPVLHCVHGLKIATHIGVVAVEMIREREYKAHVRERAESKGVPDLLGKNLTYLLRMCQVVKHTLLLPV